MVDMGADAIVCCHTHCPLPWEIYGNRPIVYGLGNLVFENTGKIFLPWHSGYLAKLTIRNSTVLVEPIPYHQSLESSGAKKLSGEEQESFLPICCMQPLRYIVKRPRTEMAAVLLGQ